MTFYHLHLTDQECTNILIICLSVICLITMTIGVILDEKKSK